MSNLSKRRVEVMWPGPVPSFDEWFQERFGRPVGSERRAAPPGVTWQEIPYSVVIEYITRAFENAGNVFAPYSNNHLAERFWHFQEMWVPFDSFELPVADRVRAIRSVLSVFEQIFARRCPDHLCHLEHSTQDEENPLPLNGACYMWWDGHSPPGSFENDPCRAEIDEAVFDVLEGTLALDSIACQESALHGLGHAIGWQDFLIHQNDTTNYWDAEPRFGRRRRSEAALSSTTTWGASGSDARTHRIRACRKRELCSLMKATPTPSPYFVPAAPRRGQ